VGHRGDGGGAGGEAFGSGHLCRCPGSRGGPSGLGTCKGAWARGADLPSCAPPGGSFGTPGPRKGGVGRGRVRRGGGWARGVEIFFPPVCCFVDSLQGTQDRPRVLGLGRPRGGVLAAGQIGISLRGRRGPLKASSSSRVARCRTLTLVKVEAAGYAGRWSGDEEGGNPNPGTPAAGYAAIDLGCRVRTVAAGYVGPRGGSCRVRTAGYASIYLGCRVRTVTAGYALPGTQRSTWAAGYAPVTAGYASYKVGEGIVRLPVPGLQEVFFPCRSGMITLLLLMNGFA